MTLADSGDVPGATPLTSEDLEGLIPTWVATRAELNLAEQLNIEAAVQWAFVGHKPVPGVPELLVSAFSDRLHRRMFGDVWAWAGRHRKRLTNIGAHPAEVDIQMKLTFDDAVYWHDHQVFAHHEIAVRLHHRLVSVHPYTNGNGCQARLLADLYMHVIDEPRLTWGGANELGSAGEDRARYIDALRAADDNDYVPLIDFAMS